MEKKAAALMGEDVEAGAILATSGTGKSLMRAGIADSIGGAVGGAIGGAAVGAVTGGGPVVDLHGHQGMLYLAVGRSNVAFLTVKQGLLGLSPVKVIASVPRESIARTTIGSGTLNSPFTVALKDGTEMALEVPRVHKGKAERVARLFGA